MLSSLSLPKCCIDWCYSWIRGFAFCFNGFSHNETGISNAFPTLYCLRPSRTLILPLKDRHLTTLRHFSGRQFQPRQWHDAFIFHINTVDASLKQTYSYTTIFCSCEASGYTGSRTPPTHTHTHMNEKENVFFYFHMLNHYFFS